MNAPADISYRLALAKGFLAEAEQDITLGRWRSCVDNSQLAVENSGKTISCGKKSVGAVVLLSMTK